MRAGQLRQRVAIEEQVEADDWSDAPDTWKEVDRVWASVVPLRTTDRVEASQVYGSTSHRVTIRARDGIKSSMRLNLDGRLLQIRGMYFENELKHWLVLMCDEIL